MKKVLFAGIKPLGRSENLSIIWSEAPKSWEKSFTIVHTASGNLDVCLAAEKGYDLVIEDDFQNAQIFRRDGKTKVVFIGHGCSGGKSFGLDQPNPYLRYTEDLDVIISSSTAMVDLVARQCGVPTEKVFPLGLPRTDRYFHPAPAGTEFDGVQGRKILYVPTFRGPTQGYLPEVNWHRVDNELGPGDRLIIKRHPLTGQGFLDEKESYLHILEVDPMVVTWPYLMACDVVVTDYSSVMFDAYVCRKPVVLFAPDAGSYLSARGMYLQYPNEYSSFQCGSWSKLVDLCHRAYFDETAEACRLKTADMCDGHATERVLELCERLCK